MSEDAQVTKSTTDQILELFLQNLAKREEFDEATLQALKELADNGMLANQDKVASALKPTE